MFGNISNCQVIAFGNTGNGRLWCFQNADNQYIYSHKIIPNSTGKEKDPETGYSYFGARYLEHELMTGWLSVDPMADKYPSISPYAYCAWNPVKLVDPSGEEVYIIFDRSTQKMYIWDMDCYDKKLKTKYVSAKDYKVGGVRDKKGRLKYNQVLVVDHVFSGGFVNDKKKIARDANRKQQRAIPEGYYDIVDNNADTRHFGWFRLDRQDKNRYNDKDDIENRDGYRFHLGKESWGCVTIDNSQEDAQEIWNVIDAIFKSTSKTRVKEKRGRQGWVPWSRLVRYGTLKVKGVDNIPIE